MHYFLAQQIDPCIRWAEDDEFEIDFWLIPYEAYICGEDLVAEMPMNWICA
jgi:hypothetical protein